MRILLILLLCLLLHPAVAGAQNKILTGCGAAGLSNAVGGQIGGGYIDQNGNVCVTGTTANNLSATSTLTPPSYTVGYATNQLIASSATASAVVVPYVVVSGTTADLVRARISVADGAAGWNNAFVKVDLWEQAPTFANGDGAAWSLATGAAHHIGSFNVQLATFGSDGSAGEAPLNFGGYGIVSLAPGGKIYWTLEYVGSGSTGTISASHPWTLRLEGRQ